MASWGPKLYQDDVAQDIRDQFKDLLRRGNTAEEITNQLIENYGKSLEDSDDAPIFWFALADTQWELGLLLPLVKDKAIAFLDDGTNLRRWQEDPSGAKAREKVLADLRKKLISPMPQKKALPQYKLFKCEWKIGDVFAYRLESDNSKDKGLWGKHLLIHKVDAHIWWPGHIIPTVRVKYLSDDQIPTEISYIDSLPYIPLGCQTDIGIPYMLHLISTSKRVIPKKLIYLGNFPDISPPNNEKIPADKISILAFPWKFLEDQLVEKIELYLNR